MTAPASSPAFPPAIVLIDNHPATAPAVDHPRVDRRLSGCPRRETWTAFEAPQGDLSAGVWTCEPGHWRIVFPPHKDEYFFVLEGRLRLHRRDDVQRPGAVGRLGVVLLRKRLLSLGNVPCADLAGRARATYERLMNRLKDREDEYDRRTAHGLRQDNPID